MVAVCGIWCFGFQVVGVMWSWRLGVRFAGCCFTLLMMGIVLPETCWASNKICNKYHLLHLVGTLFPHNRRYMIGNWKVDLWGMEAQIHPFLIWALSGSGRLHDLTAGPWHPQYSSPWPVPASRRYTGEATRLCRRGNSCHPPVLEPKFLSRRARRHAPSAVCRQTAQFVHKALYRTS